jgi:peptidoglycan/LPS O-acetylase OafA/YrhL
MIWLKRIGLILVIISIGTAIDFGVHSINAYLYEPLPYFTHKIAFGTFWALVAYIVFRKFTKTPFWMAFAMSATTSILLQTYYFVLEHDPFGKTFLFMFVHFFAFFIPGYFICKKYPYLFIDEKF